MKSIHFTCLILFIVVCGLWSCDHKTVSIKATTNVDTTEVPIDFDTSKVILKNGFYQYVFDDENGYIKWGNDSFTNITSNGYLKDFFQGGRMRLRWANDKFIVIGRGTGSDTWFRIVLPLIPGEKGREYWNPLAFDEANGLVVYMNDNKGDSIWIVENMLSGKQLAIGKGLPPCGSAGTHYCVDSISIVNRELYLEWVTPHKHDDDKVKVVKRIQIDL